VLLVGSLTKYRAQYFDDEWLPGVPVPMYTPKAGASERVFKAMSDIAMRLSAEDYLKMPDRRSNNIVVEMPASARADYDKMERDFFAEVGAGTITAGNAAARSVKLRQIANGAVYDEDGVTHAAHTAKLEALADLIEEQQGAPLLVAVSFQSDVARIRAHLGLSVDELPYLGGGMSAAYADKVCAKWNRGELPVVLAHPASVAHGLNLQAGGHAVCWFGLTWSLEEYIQLNARVYRQGQSHGVVIHHIIAAGTVDADVAEVLADKDAKQGALFAALTRRVNSLSTNKE
jgi:SNF2 family DNA or RNA helicase